MAARGAEYGPQSPGGHNTYTMSPAVTMERNNIVKFDPGLSIDTGRSPVREKPGSQQSELHTRSSLVTRSEGEIQDTPRNTKEGLFARILSYKWKSDAKDDEKDLC